MSVAAHKFVTVDYILTLPLCRIVTAVSETNNYDSSQFTKNSITKSSLNSIWIIREQYKKTLNETSYVK